MNPRQIISNNSPIGISFLGLEPPRAWMAILGLVLFSALCILVGAGSILRLAFPMGSFAVGILLYRRYPILYLGFTWWLWFLTPLVARLVDYRSGSFDEQRLMLVAPYLVTLITLDTLLRHFPKAYRQGGLPFILALIGVFYGSLVGLIQNPPFAVARSVLDWLIPVVFSFYLFVNWREYPSYRQNTQRVFLWGVLVTGVYGVLQYLVAPEWDRFWLVESGMTSSAGDPEPLGMRVWSTMNAPGSFSSLMVAGLLLLFTSQSALRLPANAVGYLAFLLSLVRSGWGGWLVGLVALASSLKAHLQIRLAVTALILALCVFPLITIEPFSEKINSRFQTFSNLEEDSSFNARSENYSENLSVALSEGLGKGIGSDWVVTKSGVLDNVVIDSGILETFFTLGWFGAVPYLGGLIFLLFSVIQYSEARFDFFMNTARAVGIALTTGLVIGSSILGFGGLLLWGFLGITMAAHKHYQHQGTTRLRRN